MILGLKLGNRRLPWSEDLFFRDHYLFGMKNYSALQTFVRPAPTFNLLNWPESAIRFPTPGLGDEQVPTATILSKHTQLQSSMKQVLLFSKYKSTQV